MDNKTKNFDKRTMDNKTKKFDIAKSTKGIFFLKQYKQKGKVIKN